MIATFAAFMLMSAAGLLIIAIVAVLSQGPKPKGWL